MSSLRNTQLKKHLRTTEKLNTSLPPSRLSRISLSNHPPSSLLRRNKSDLSIIIHSFLTTQLNINSIALQQFSVSRNLIQTKKIVVRYRPKTQQICIVEKKNVQLQQKKIQKLLRSLLLAIHKCHPIKQERQKMHIIQYLTLIVSLLVMNNSSLPQAFDYLSNIDPSIILQPRYAIPQNFVGDIIDGYLRKTVVITKNAGYALANVQGDLKKLGYSLVVYDAYRPQKGVDHFIRWSEQPEDFKTKTEFYPYLEKSLIIPEGYVATKSGHSRGSTVDLTIIPLGKSVHEITLFNYTLTDGTVILYRDDGTEFMGGHFDYFGELSHHDTPLVQQEETNKRNLLRSLMQKHGFNPYSKEWWHYTLTGEPFPDTYFDFDVV